MLARNRRDRRQTVKVSFGRNRICRKLEAGGESTLRRRRRRRERTSHQVEGQTGVGHRQDVPHAVDLLHLCWTEALLRILMEKSNRQCPMNVFFQAPNYFSRILNLQQQPCVVF